MRLRPKITPISPERTRREKYLYLCAQTAQVRSAPRTSEKITKKQKEENNDHTKSLAKLTQDFISVSKFDSDQVNTGRGGNLLHGHRHQVGMNDNFIISFNRRVKVFRLQAMTIPL